MVEIVRLDYIWIDGSGEKDSDGTDIVIDGYIMPRLRHKAMFLTLNKELYLGEDDLPKVSNLPIVESKQNFMYIPEWSIDGSSTRQAPTKPSDLPLKPVRVKRNPLRSDTLSFLVLTEVLDFEGNPHLSNKRPNLEKLANLVEEYKPLIGIEQEYTLVNPTDVTLPFNWSQNPKLHPPQGEHYCGVDEPVYHGEIIMDKHADACNAAGIPISGTNAEVMHSQFEFQPIPLPPLEAADNLWFARFLLQKIAAQHGAKVSYNPKPIENKNGAGAHFHFSTERMRKDGGDYIHEVIRRLEKAHDELMKVYGKGNEKRMTGKFETARYDKFTTGVADRGASVRIPRMVHLSGKGRIEDRRPASNVNPYEGIAGMLKAVFF